MNAIQFGALKFNRSCSKSDQKKFEGTEGIINESVNAWNDLGFDVLVTHQNDDSYGVAICEKGMGDALLEMFELDQEKYNEWSKAEHLKADQIFHGFDSVKNAKDAVEPLYNYASIILRFLQVIKQNQTQ
ncbi:MAG: hypothetical protein QE263_06260 [Vampirovibrionales bacterium]|nr:hypothetical protein [Vampirovibrionales bacterium]